MRICVAAGSAFNLPLFAAKIIPEDTCKMACLMLCTKNGEKIDPRMEAERYQMLFNGCRCCIWIEREWNEL